MEMLVIGLVAIAAFTAVLIPLFRRRPGFGDEKEFENIPAAAADSKGQGGEADSAEKAVESDGHAPALPASDAAIAAGSGPGQEHVEAEVLRYREAVRAGTVCRKCGQANPAGSSYCYECGSRLPLADAQEFE